VSLKLLVDMNLTPDWVRTFQEQGWDAVHWSAFVDPGAADSEIMQWAAAHDYVVLPTISISARCWRSRTDLVPA